MDRSTRPRLCCREAANLVPIPLPAPGAGVSSIAAEQCHAPADDGLIVVDGTRRCGRRHFIARMEPGQYGVTPGSLTMAGG